MSLQALQRDQGLFVFLPRFSPLKKPPMEHVMSSSTEQREQLTVPSAVTDTEPPAVFKSFSDEKYDGGKKSLL